MNWDDLRFIAAVARTGSLLGASARLGVDHTTVGRRVSAAERALGVVLFVRGPRGLSITPEGLKLIAPISAVEEAIHEVERRAGADEPTMTGRITVTAPETLGCVVVAPLMAQLSSLHPGVVITVDASGTTRSLHRREAEVAVRTWRSDDASLVIKKAGQLRMGAYVAKSLASRRGIRRAADLAQLPQIVGADDELGTHWLRTLAPEAPISLRCELSLGVQAALRAGHAVGTLPRYLGDVDDELVRIPCADEPVEPIYLTVHKDLRRTARVRVVLDALHEAFAAWGHGS
jgi:DNA-binding transcriptional LysR family regulator